MFIDKGHRAIVTIAQDEMQESFKDGAEMASFAFMERNSLLSTYYRKEPLVFRQRGILDEEFVRIIREAYVTGALVVSNDRLDVVCESFRPLKIVAERIVKFCWVRGRLSLYPDTNYPVDGQPNNVYTFKPDEKVGKVVNSLSANVQKIWLSIIDRYLSGDDGNAEAGSEL
uniref:RNase_Zc3h12a domain-containing protein n=1 Tax=Trichuris muris TaxID=70415 RepID=A0A5S6QHV7_TRIMR